MLISKEEVPNSYFLFFLVTLSNIFNIVRRGLVLKFKTTGNKFVDLSQGTPSTWFLLFRTNEMPNPANHREILLTFGDFTLKLISNIRVSTNLIQKFSLLLLVLPEFQVTKRNRRFTYELWNINNSSARNLWTRPKIPISFPSCIPGIQRPWAPILEGHSHLSPPKTFQVRLKDSAELSLYLPDTLSHNSLIHEMPMRLGEVIVWRHWIGIWDN